MHSRLEDIVGPATSNGCDDLMRRSSDAGNPGVTVESRCLKRDGRALWCKLNLAPFPDRHSDRVKNPKAYIATLEDVSETPWPASAATSSVSFCTAATSNAG